jgi:thiol-disulfide isomerase/thioredoxin
MKTFFVKNNLFLAASPRESGLTFRGFIMFTKTRIYTTLILLSLITFSQAEEVDVLPIGAAAPEFNLLGIDDKYHTLKSYQNAEILVIIFTANHCPTAQAYEDRMIRLVNDYKEKGVAFVAISSNNPEAVRLDEMGYTDLGDSFEDMKQRAKDKKYNFPYLYDGDEQKALIAYGPMSTPHLFIFDKERKCRFTGRIDDYEDVTKVTTKDTRNAIEALLAGKPVPVETTKTFGCSMKWASLKSTAEAAIQKWNTEEVFVEMIDVDGIGRLLKNDSGYLRLINVWATWCGPCVSEFPELIEINRMYRLRDFEMVTISADAPEKKDKVLEFLKKNYASVKNYHFNSDDNYALIEAVDKDWPGALPYTLLVKPGGEIIYKKLGIIDPLDLKKAIVEYLGRDYH